MTQSIATRAELLTRMNDRTEIFVEKLEDEFRVQLIVGSPPLPDADLRTPIIPGLYFLDLALQYRTPGSIISTNGFRFRFTGPLGVTDGAHGSFGGTGTLQRNGPGEGLLTLTDLPTGATFINTNQYGNRSGYVRIRAPGELVLNWTSIIPGGAGVTLIRGASIHLIRAINDGD